MVQVTAWPLLAVFNVDYTENSTHEDIKSKQFSKVRIVNKVQNAFKVKKTDSDIGTVIVKETYEVKDN